jgi:hypothetical protein
MTEADYEYLLRTLSEARSRATEIAIAVRGRVGVDHRLSELGNSAVAQIESVLRDMRRVASEESDTVNSGGGRPASEAETKTSTEAAKNNAGPLAPSAQAGDLAAEHWFPAFINELLERYRTAGGITFETVEHVLEERKQAFAKDLEIARRMYHSYPHLFQETQAPRS